MLKRFECITFCNYINQLRLLTSSKHVPCQCFAFIRYHFSSIFLNLEMISDILIILLFSSILYPFRHFIFQNHFKIYHFLLRMTLNCLKLLESLIFWLFCNIPLHAETMQEWFTPQISFLFHFNKWSPSLLLHQDALI